MVGSRHLVKLIFVAAGVTGVLSSSVARADGDILNVRPYGFSGTCSSQGLWTQDALQLTQQIRNFTVQLKNDPNCQALGTRVQASLLALAEKVKPQPQVGEKHSQDISHLSQELPALWAQFRAGLQDQPRPIEKLFTPADNRLNLTIFKKTLQSALLTTQVALDGPIGERLSAATRDGLSLFNDVIDAAPQMEQCLTGDGVVAGQMMATSIKLLTSFVASGQDASGSSVATSLSKLSQVMRDMRFANILRKLNQADFLASMSCLIEMTTENYCTTRDSKILFDDILKQLQTRSRDAEQKRLGASHPLAGYYILTQNVPIISAWVQRVQIGVDPRVPTDAQFQNKVFDEVNNFFKRVKDIQGKMSMDIEAMKLVTDKEGRQAAALRFVETIYGLLTTTHFQDDVNFFSYNGSRSETMFLLLGIPMPPEVTGANGAFAQPVEQWLQNNYRTLPIFADPDELVKRVTDTVQNKMITAAKNNAIQYYNKWFIIDKISLVNESLLGLNYNVKDSLKLIDRYLTEVEKRIVKTSKDVSTIGGLRETQAKIRSVLAAYDDLEKVSREYSEKPEVNLTEDDRLKILNANVAVITAVYKEFEVLLGKSGWFGNRVKDFVILDYQSLLKQKSEFSRNVNDWAYAAGLSIFDRIVASASGNPAAVQNDLSTALRLNKMNLEAVELLIKDYFVSTTVELQAVVKASKGGATYSDQAIVTEGPGRARRDYLTKLPGETEGSAISNFGRKLYAGSVFWGQVFSNIPVVGPYVFGEKKYEKQRDRFALDDEFGSAKHIFEQFCIQSLAFSDVRSFYSTCQGVVLPSPFPVSFLSQLSAEERKSLSVAYQEKLMESKDNAPLNLSKRICAFRDYNRKNLVTYLTSARPEP